MYSLGWLLLLGGAGLAGYGIYEKNEIKESHYGYGSYYRADDIDDVETLIMIGIVIAFIGLFVLIARYIVGKKSGTTGVNLANGIAYAPVGNFVSTGTCCSCCGAAVDAGSTFCFRCGASLVHKETNAVKHCATCGAILPAGSLFCAQCGTKAVAEEPKAILQCSICGAELQAGTAFCSKCGTKVEN